MQHPPGGRLGRLRTDAVDSLRTEAEQEDEDQSDEEAGQQEDRHDDHLLLVHTDLCEQEHTQSLKPLCQVGRIDVIVCTRQACFSLHADKTHHR